MYLESFNDSLNIKNAENFWLNSMLNLFKFAYTTIIDHDFKRFEKQ